jgi:cyclopropane fatty-acyl-phospholipid synthase-like methyltransferase
VQSLNKSVRELLRDRTFEGRFDLIYSAGLYDYLEKKVATKLTDRLFELLAPGGYLLLTNFLPSIRSWGMWRASWIGN